MAFSSHRMSLFLDGVRASGLEALLEAVFDVCLVALVLAGGVLVLTGVVLTLTFTAVTGVDCLLSFNGAVLVGVVVLLFACDLFIFVALPCGVLLFFG